MSNKKYYWLKLKDDFFRQKEIKKLRKIAGGDTYTVIYLKMLLLAIKNDNRLYFEGVEECFADELALELDEDVDNVRVTLAFLQTQRLIEMINEDEYSLLQCETMTGVESASAERVRKHRLKQKEEQRLLQCNTNVTDGNKNVTTEKEIEKEKELEIETDIELESKRNIIEQSTTPSLPYTDIIDYLNKKTGKNFKSTSKATQKYIKARFNDGFTLEDFKRVIDIKCEEWLKDSKMSIYLRPETLFGTKFESYLNSKQKSKPTGPYVDSTGLTVL